MTRTVRPRRRCAPGVTAVALTTLGALTTAIAAGVQLPASGSPPSAAAGADPAALVHPLDGTGTGPVTPGTVGQFLGRTSLSA